MIEYVLKHGYDPSEAADEPKNKFVKNVLVKSRDELSTVIQMKGYYPQ